MTFTKAIILFFVLISNLELYSQSNKIAIIGDPQRTLWFEFFRKQNEEIRQAIFPQIASESPNALIILGDLTNWGASNFEWNYFDSIVKPIKTANIPIYPVIGNHDYYGNSNQALVNMKSRFDYFGNYTWYSKEINTIGFVFLNSNLDDLSKAERKLQKVFLDSILKSYDNNTKIHNVVCLWHHPIYTNSKLVDDEQNIKAEFMPFVSKSKKTKLIASGHCHSYEHFKIGRPHYLVSGGAGGPKQEVYIKYEARHKDLYIGEEVRDFHYSLLEEIENKLQVKVMGFNEQTKKWYEMDKWIAD
jgi:predicted phosphohydrolase